MNLMLDEELDLLTGRLSASHRIEQHTVAHNTNGLAYEIETQEIFGTSHETIVPEVEFWFRSVFAQLAFSVMPPPGFLRQK